MYDNFLNTNSLPNKNTINLSNVGAIADWTIGMAKISDLFVNTIDISDNWYIQGWQSWYNAGTWFFLWYSWTAYKFSLWDSTNENKQLLWNWTDLIINGSKVINEDKFWNWSDWDVTISADTTLTADMYYDNLIINSWKILTPNWFRIFCRTSFLNNWTVNWSWWSGTNGSWRTGWWVAWSVLMSATGFFYFPYWNPDGWNGWLAVAGWNAWLASTANSGWVGFNTNYASISGWNGWNSSLKSWWVSYTWTVSTNSCNPRIYHELVSFTNFSWNIWWWYYNYPLISAWASAGWWGWASDATLDWWKGGWSWARWWIILIVAKKYTNNWTIESNGWNWWNWASDATSLAGWGWWGGGWNGWTIILIYSSKVATWIVTVSAGIKWTGWLWNQWNWSDWSDGAIWNIVELQV